MLPIIGVKREDIILHEDMMSGLKQGCTDEKEWIIAGGEFNLDVEDISFWKEDNP